MYNNKKEIKLSWLLNNCKHVGEILKIIKKVILIKIKISRVNKYKK